MSIMFIITFAYAIVAFFYLMYRYYPILFLRRKEYVPLNFSVTVVVPVYDEPASNLRHCLQSIVDADGDNEIVVVDDCSTLEETREAISEYQQKYPKITNQQNF